MLRQILRAVRLSCIDVGLKSRGLAALATKQRLFENVGIQETEVGLRLARYTSHWYALIIARMH